MRFKTTTVCLILAWFALNGDAAPGDFISLESTNSAPLEFPVVDNPFTNVHPATLASIEIQNSSTNAVIADTNRIVHLLRLASNLKIVDGFITMNGPGYFSLQHYKNTRGAIVLTAGINTTDGEVVVMSPSKIIGVAYDSIEYVRHIQAVQPFSEITEKIIIPKKAPNKNLEPISGSQ